jgi:hypothetical protein
MLLHCDASFKEDASNSIKFMDAATDWKFVCASSMFSYNCQASSCSYVQADVHTQLPFFAMSTEGTNRGAASWFTGPHQILLQHSKSWQWLLITLQSRTFFWASLTNSSRNMSLDVRKPDHAA